MKLNNGCVCMCVCFPFWGVCACLNCCLFNLNMFAIVWWFLSMCHTCRSTQSEKLLVGHVLVSSCSMVVLCGKTMAVDLALLNSMWPLGQLEVHIMRIKPPT